MSISLTDGDGKKELEVALKSVEGYIGKVGWVQEKKYPDSEMTTAQVAAIAEIGWPDKNIPARPVVKPAINDHEKDWGNAMEAEVKKVFDGTQTGKGAFEKVTLMAAGHIRENITKLVDPPLAEATVKARERHYGSRRKTKKARKKQIAQRIASGTLRKPLVQPWSKYFLNSCTNAVEKE